MPIHENSTVGVCEKQTSLTNSTTTRVAYLTGDVSKTTTAAPQRKQVGGVMELVGP